MTPTPPTTFVLLHGAGLGSWCWHAVTPLLRLPALAVDLPGRGATPCDLSRATRTTYVEAVVEAISSAKIERAILVAHSFSGSIAHLVAAALPQQIEQIVFLGAAVPPAGQSVIDTFTAMGRVSLQMGMAMATAGIDMPRWMWYMGMRLTFTELDAATRRMVYDRLVMPEAPAMFLEPLDRNSWPAIPCSYIKLLRDRSPVPAHRQDRVIQELPAPTVYTLATGHTAMLSAPRDLAELLNAIAYA